jgi:hypothetical protein
MTRVLSVGRLLQHSDVFATVFALACLSSCLTFGRGEPLAPGWRRIADAAEDPYDLPDRCAQKRFRPSAEVPTSARCYQLSQKTMLAGEPFRILLSDEPLLVQSDRMTCAAADGASVPCPAMAWKGMYLARAYTEESQFAGRTGAWWRADDGTIGIRWSDNHAVLVACLPNQSDGLSGALYSWTPQTEEITFNTLRFNEVHCEAQLIEAKFPPGEHQQKPPVVEP